MWRRTRLWPLSRQSYPKHFMYVEKIIIHYYSKLIKNINLENLEQPIIILMKNIDFLVQQMRNMNQKKKYSRNEGEIQHLQ